MIKQQYRILVLTDHRGHSAENSLYALLRGMLQSNRCAGIDIASRGFAINDAFFYQKNAKQIFGSAVNANFEYDSTAVHYKKEQRPLDLSDYDCVFLRIARPLSDDFLAWLPNAFPHQLIVNHPIGILATSTKAFLLNFPSLCPPMQLCHNVQDVLDFAAKYDLVLKPLQEYGGKGLMKIEKEIVDDGDLTCPLASYLPQLAQRLETGAMLAMKFLQNVSQGDKRIIVVDGEIMAASLRLPPPDSWLCNVARGGRSVATEVTPEEQHIIDTISPRLREEGILIYGADTLVDDNGQRVLSEVNTLSIGGFPQAEAQTGRPVISLTIDKLFNYADVHYAG